MNWESWGAFVAMGGYGFYVWGAFGMTAAVILAELATLAVHGRALRRFGHTDETQN